MQIVGMRIEGLRTAPNFSGEGWEQAVQLPSGPEGVGVADALTLFVGALHTSRVQTAVEQVGLSSASEAEVWEDKGLPGQVSWPSPAPTRTLLADGTQQITIALDLTLDPPLFGQLRELAFRDPRLISALAEQQGLTVKVGWLFTKDHTVVSPSVLHISLGGVAFPTQGSDRPGWLPELLQAIAHRLSRVDWTRADSVVGSALARAALSPNPDLRSRFQRIVSACTEAPFSLESLQVVHRDEGFELRFGPDLLRSRQLGPTGPAILRLMEAIFLDLPDVLVVEAPGTYHPDVAALSAWLESCTEGEAAPLEQVILVPGGPK